MENEHCPPLVETGYFKVYIPRASDEDDTGTGNSSSNYDITPIGGHYASTDLASICPLHGESSLVSRLEPVTCR
ncbi:hypothetical protein TNCV_4658831 [Trichonephila clavipes]|nr:hypothetical protein TNCV_4658831 [Trichonephila clavipes]